jgi:GntR family transcriptional repressor for pyruvate dehydrogenase complex
MLDRIRRYERVAMLIRQRIVEGDYRVGERLPTERQLAEEHAVSRNVLREAIRFLAREGLVEVRQGSGTYVTDRTGQALGDSLGLLVDMAGGQSASASLLEARLIIEPSLAALAAARATPAQIAAMRAEIEAMDRAAEDAGAFIAADQKFHLLIARASANPIVPLMLDPIVDKLKANRARIFRSEDTVIAQRFHREILGAIERRDGAAAFAAMTRHLTEVSTRVQPV